MNIEEQIRRAREEGHFENLPGKGKPLNLEDRPFENPEWRLANKVLKDAGYTLPWIEHRREIEEGLAKAREGLKRAWEWRQERLQSGRQEAFAESEWRRSLKKFEDQIEALNKRIFSYNLETPSSQLQLLSLKVEREIAAVAQNNRFSPQDSNSE